VWAYRVELSSYQKTTEVTGFDLMLMQTNKNKHRIIQNIRVIFWSNSPWCLQLKMHNIHLNNANHPVFQFPKQPTLPQWRYFHIHIAYMGHPVKSSQTCNQMYYVWMLLKGVGQGLMEGCAGGGQGSKGTVTPQKKINVAILQKSQDFQYSLQRTDSRETWSMPTNFKCCIKHVNI
jgi:hypothetical protein